ncbi:MAG TPA: gluconate 2-dehydrogenase subunit 3 family protein [Acidobacteriaceae bacterium]|nr:gluconate 2-dehydrogenase subunit 3 family protein [Acidobacteriaceae bacterium]
MKRREFVKSLVAASVSAKTLLGQSTAGQVAPATPPPTLAGAAPRVAPGPVPWMRGLLEAKPLPVGAVVPDAVAIDETKFFTDRQMATLRQLCEILLPPLQGNPGAIDAGAPQFLDFLISVSPPDRQELYRSGLDRLDREAREKFGVGFADVSGAQADALLRPWMRAWLTDHPPTEPYEAFINLAHADIRTATVNSQAWNDAATANGEGRQGVGLYWFPVQPDVEEKYLPRELQG